MTDKSAEYAINRPMANAFEVGFQLAGLGEYRLAERMTELAREDEQLCRLGFEVSHDQVQRYRKNARIVPLWAMDLLADVVGRSVDELIAQAKGRPTIEAQRARAVRQTAEALDKIKQAILGDRLRAEAV